MEQQPSLISFTASPNRTILSTSYHQQSLFAHHRGTHTLPITPAKGTFDPLWWCAQIDTSTSTASSSVYIKLVNAAPTSLTNSTSGSIPLKLSFDSPLRAVNGTIITHPTLHGFNYLNNQTAIVPQSIEGLPKPQKKAAAWEWEWMVPGQSIVVLEFR